LSVASTLSRSEPRLARREGRATARPRSRWLRAAVLAPAVAVAVAGVAGFASTTSVFHARHIRVVGISHLHRADVLRLASVGGATNVVWLDPGRVARALEADPWVADATVSRSLPSTLRIAIRERRPAATVQVGSTWLLVAGDGTVLGRAASRPRLPMLQIEGPVTIGARPRSVVETAAVAAGMTRWLRARIATVTPLADGTLEIGLVGGGSARFGPPTDIRAKDQVLAGILRWAHRNGRRLATIDVRAPIAPSALPATG
jgi:cell division protein FtsQ